MIRPAKCHFKGFIKAFIKGADKNHNPRKGTETILRSCCTTACQDKNHNPRKGTETSALSPNISRYPTFGIRTIIPVRGRKLVVLRSCSIVSFAIRTIIPARGRKLFMGFEFFGCWVNQDKNHNPRKGTETCSIQAVRELFR